MGESRGCSKCDIWGNFRGSPIAWLLVHVPMHGLLSLLQPCPLRWGAWLGMGICRVVVGNWTGVQHGDLYVEGGTRSWLPPPKQVGTAPHLPEGKILLFLPFAWRDSTTQEPCQLSRAQVSLFSGLVVSTTSPKPLPMGWDPRLATAGGERASRLHRGTAPKEGIQHTRHRSAETLAAGYGSPFSSLPPLPFPVYLSRSTHIYIFLFNFFFSTKVSKAQHQLPSASGPALGVPPAPGQPRAVPTRFSPLLPFLLRFSWRCLSPRSSWVASPPPPSPPCCRPGGRGAHLPDVNISEGEAGEECAAPSPAQVINPCDWQVATGGLWLRLLGKSARRKDFNSSSAPVVRAWQGRGGGRAAQGENEV